MNYRKQTTANEQDLHYFKAYFCQEEGLNGIIQNYVDYACMNEQLLKERTQLSGTKSFFKQLSANIIKKTFVFYIQYSRTLALTIFKKNCNFLFLFLSAKYYNEPVAADTLCSDTLAIDNR